MIPPDNEPTSDEHEPVPEPRGPFDARWFILAAALLVLLAGFAFMAGQDSERPGLSSTDVGFLQDMTAHHDQAVTISLLHLGRGEDPVVRTFAQEVVLFQRWELGIMYQMLESADAPPAEDGPVMAWMGAPVEPDEMPGLATPEQLDELRASSGNDADQLFLVLMRAHHLGGVHMADYAAEYADDSDVSELAARMARNQRLEVTEYDMALERLDSN